MTKHLRGNASRANRSPAISGGDSRQRRRRIFEPLRAAHGLCKGKVADFISALTGAGKRTAERWLSPNGAMMPADKFVDLLRTEHGFHFLEAAMAGAEPSWWTRMRRQHRIALLRRDMARVERELRAESESLAEQ